jgi:DNA-directed RNA polymerase alpha subunit
MKRVGPPEHRRRKREDPQWQQFFTPEEQEAARRQEKLDMSLADTGLSVRIVNNLEDQGIEFVRDLVKLDRNELLAIENFGESTLVECRQAIDKLKIAHPNWSLPAKHRHKPTPGRGPRK